MMVYGEYYGRVYKVYNERAYKGRAILENGCHHHANFMHWPEGNIGLELSAILAYSMAIPYWGKDVRAAKLTESESHVSFPMPCPATFPLSAVRTASRDEQGWAISYNHYGHSKQLSWSGFGPTTFLQTKCAHARFEYMWSLMYKNL